MADSIHSRSTDAQSLNLIFTLLSNQRRRRVVTVLLERESPIALHELVTAVASWETDETEWADVSADLTDEVAAALHHVHLPKLDEADLIDYDTETNAVTSARTEVLSPFFRGPEGVK